MESGVRGSQGRDVQRLMVFVGDFWLNPILQLLKDWQRAVQNHVSGFIHGIKIRDIRQRQK